MPGPTYHEQLRHIVNEYIESGRPWPATARDIAAWAIAQNRWKPQHNTLVKQCAEHVAEAMREEYFRDPQGRAVRAKHAARIMREGQQLALWADIRTADREFMQIAFQQRRQQIVGDCRQLKLDVDSYNENGNHGSSIQLVLDFSEDIAELEALERLSV